MNVIIVAAGILGLAAAGYFLVEMTVDAVRRREYLDIAVAVAVVVATVWLLIAFGDRLLQ